MADHCGPKIRHRDYFIESATTGSTKIVECLQSDAVNEKDSRLEEMFGVADWRVREKLSLASMQLTQLPEEFGVYMNNLVELDLSNNKLTLIPNSLRFPERLERLSLDRNSMKTLPLAVVELSHLRVLHLSNNFLKSLPSNFGDVVSLETLIARRNKLDELPASFAKLKNLKYLDLSENSIERLPDQFGYLESLESLIVRSNKLSDLPDSCGDLKRLVNLDLSRNRFNRFPSCLTRGMTNLEALDVSLNKYMSLVVAPASAKLREFVAREIGRNTKFPYWLFTGCAPALEILDLDGTRFAPFTIPDNCATLAMRSVSLQRCGLYDPFMRDLTRRTDRLETLRIGNGALEFYGNAFASLPIENLESPELLTEIDLRRTGLFEISGAIEKCVNLAKLDIGNNNINFLCEEICSLAKLKVLLIDENYLNSLPCNIGLMNSLKELKANDNGLDCLPKSIRDLKNLTYLDLYNNDFERMPIELEHVDTLLGLDLDQNNFAIDETDTIGDTSYQNLRKAIRNLYRNRGCIRCEGPRYASDRSEEADTGSDISSIEFHDSGTKVKENTNVIEEEDWDNSADEFEPGRAVVESHLGPYRWFTLPLPAGLTTFCPADLHVRSVRHRAVREEGNNVAIDELTVEGRFDDA